MNNECMAETGAQAGRGPRNIRVFLLDDHEMVRRGLYDLLSGEPDIEVVGEAALADEALLRIPTLLPDVAILDARLPDGHGVDVCREIRSSHPQVNCLMFTSYDDDEALLSAIMAGASGYVLKQIRGTDFVDAVRPLATLSDQERRVLELIAEGMTNRQIGERLFLAEKTVKKYVSSLLAKLGLQRRVQAAAFAVTLSRN